MQITLFALICLGPGNVLLIFVEGVFMYFDSLFLYSTMLVLTVG